MSLLLIRTLRLAVGMVGDANRDSLEVFVRPAPDASNSSFKVSVSCSVEGVDLLEGVAGDTVLPSARWLGEADSSKETDCSVKALLRGVGGSNENALSLGPMLPSESAPVADASSSEFILKSR